MDTEPVLRHFGGKKRQARERFGEFVKAGMKDGHREEFYKAAEGRIQFGGSHAALARLISIFQA